MFAQLGVSTMSNSRMWRRCDFLRSTKSSFRCSLNASTNQRTDDWPYSSHNLNFSEGIHLATITSPPSTIVLGRPTGQIRRTPVPARLLISRICHSRQARPSSQLYPATLPALGAQGRQNDGQVDPVCSKSTTSNLKPTVIWIDKVSVY
jgi:hypothetical protein